MPNQITTLPSNLELFRKYQKLALESKAKDVPTAHKETNASGVRPAEDARYVDFKAEDISGELDRLYEEKNKGKVDNTPLYDPHNKEHVKQLQQAATYSG